MSVLQLELRRLFIALGYFTRLPIPAWVGWSAQELDRAARYFPLVGFGIGVLAAAVLALGLSVLPASLAVALSMLTTILATGAFHEDGLADAADGLGGGHERGRALAIMQDSRIGSFGSIALILALLLKFAALLELARWQPELAMLGMVVAHAGSRAAALGVMALLPYARSDETQAKARPVAQGIRPMEWGTGIALGLAPLLLACLLQLLAPQRGLLVVLALAACTMCAARYFHRRIGGYTGDCLGATQQVAELSVYLLLCGAIA